MVSRNVKDVGYGDDFKKLCSRDSYEDPLPHSLSNR